MNRRKRLSTAVESALPAVASVVCGIISEYSYERMHAWIDQSSAPVAVNQISEVQSIVTNSFAASDYRRIVSSTTIRDGRLVWSVKNNLRICAFVGVTTSSDCSYTTSGLAFNTTWTMTRYSDCIRTYENNIPMRSWPVTDFGDGSDIVDFVADPAKRQVTARFRGSKINGGIDLLDAAVSDDDFWNLRPCVLLGAATSAILMSSDDAD